MKDSILASSTWLLCWEDQTNLSHPLLRWGGDGWLLAALDQLTLTANSHSSGKEKKKKIDTIETKNKVLEFRFENNWDGLCSNIPKVVTFCLKLRFPSYPLRLLTSYRTSHDVNKVKDGVHVCSCTPVTAALLASKSVVPVKFSSRNMKYQ